MVMIVVVPVVVVCLYLSAVADGHTGSTEWNVTGRESSGAAQTPGPSAHTLPSEDEKRRLHYELQTTPPPLLSPSSQTPFPFLPPSPPLSTSLLLFHTPSQ